MPSSVKDASNTITIWNPAAEKLFGFREEEMLGCPVKSSFFPDSLRGQYDRVRFTHHDESLAQIRDANSEQKSGQLLDVSISLSHLRSRTGAFMGTAWMIRKLHRVNLLETGPS